MDLVTRDGGRSLCHRRSGDGRPELCGAVNLAEGELTFFFPTELTVSVTRIKGSTVTIAVASTNSISPSSVRPSPRARLSPLPPACRVAAVAQAGARSSGLTWRGDAAAAAAEEEEEVAEHE